MAEPLEIEHRDLRSAIEFAVLVAEEANKGKRSLPFPKELRAQFGVARIPTGALGRLRRVIEVDDTFRSRIAVGAVPELVDPIGILWLQRPTGWEDQIRELLAVRAAEEHDTDLRTALKRAEKRRVAAEQVAIRSQATIVEQQATLDSLRDELDGVRADLAKAEETVGELRSELVDVRNEARHARDREAALRTKLEAARPGSDAAPVVVPPPAPVPRSTSANSTTSRWPRGRSAIASMRWWPPWVRRPPRRMVRPNAIAEHRRPLRLPGGVIASSRAAAEFLVRTDAAVVVDGYNVAMLGWPTERLEEQRRRLLDGLENLARRHGTDVTVIFDGSTVVGAHADRRRMVRVAYSPEGVIADDVIRDEVRRLPAKRAVVVVTNDAEIVRDVRTLGANVVPSNAFLATL